MTVRELIARLSELPPDVRVLVRDVDGELVEVDDAREFTAGFGPWVREQVAYVSGS